MIIGVPKEIKDREHRVALTPQVVKDLIKLSFSVLIEDGAGAGSYLDNHEYEMAGATLVDPSYLFTQSDVILSVNAPSEEALRTMKPKAALICFFYPVNEPNTLQVISDCGLSIFAMNAVPRISRAQKMDALSSQSNLAGYKTVMLAANAFGKIFPMLMTAAGTIKPTKVVILGAGVAGLQALATAKRLGAIVEVSDIRPETKEQVESLGGYFIELKGDDSMKTEGGYVTDISEEFLRKQKELTANHIKSADIVITTALIPGKKAPLLISAEMVQSMRPGSVIVDMAVEQGGNCELSELNLTVVKHGVTIIGESNLPSLLASDASQLYAKNISSLLLHLADKDQFHFDLEDAITSDSLLVHEGKIRK